MTDGPLRHVQNPRRHRRPPTPQALAAATPPASPPVAERPLTTINTARVSRAALESSLGARIPGVAGVNFREQKSCLQTMRNFGAQRLRCCHKPGLKLSLKEGGCPGRSRLRGRPQGPRSADFSAALGVLFPRQRADKSHACTRASKSRRRQNYPTRRLTRSQGERKPAALRKERESAAHTSTASPARAGELAPTPLRTSPLARLPGRVAYCARRTRAVTASARQVVRAVRPRPPCARSPAGAERFVPSDSRGGGNRLVTS